MAKNDKNQIIDESTGEIRVVRGTRAGLVPPKRKEITRISDVAGNNIPATNLRDHPEYNGMELIIMQAKFKSSTLGGDQDTYLLAACYVVPEGQEAKEENFIMLMTGSENIQGRVMDAMIQAGENTDPFPLVGKLRKAGRAWFLD